MKLLINTDETAESLEAAGDRKEAGGQRAVVNPGKEFRPDPRAAAREEEEEGAGQPGANKTLSLDDVAVANANRGHKGGRDHPDLGGNSISLHRSNP